MKAAEFKVVRDARRVVQGQFSHYYAVMSRAGTAASAAAASQSQPVRTTADKKEATAVAVPVR